MQLAKMRLEILGNADDNSKDNIFISKLQDAKYEYLRLVFPYNPEIEELPHDRARNWQTKCAIELYNNMGRTNVTSYAENGISESYEKGGLSKDLLNELPPAKAGVPQ